MYNIETPQLVEGNIKHMTRTMIQKCVLFKKNYYELALNISFVVITIVLTAIVLYYRYTHRMTPEQKKELQQLKKNQLLDTIKTIQKTQKHLSHDLITGMPIWENEYEKMYV